MGRRLHAFRHPSAQHGFIHDASIDALEPIIPPTQHLLQEADLRAGKAARSPGALTTSPSSYRRQVSGRAAGTLSRKRTRPGPQGAHATTEEGVSVRGTTVGMSVPDAENEADASSGAMPRNRCPFVAPPRPLDRGFP